jgi:hypothetical protein
VVGRALTVFSLSAVDEEQGFASVNEGLYLAVIFSVLLFPVLIGEHARRLVDQVQAESVVLVLLVNILYAAHAALLHEWRKVKGEFAFHLYLAPAFGRLSER